jgi:hypothetical protein
LIINLDMGVLALYNGAEQQGKEERLFKIMGTGKRGLHEGGQGESFSGTL